MGQTAIELDGRGLAKGPDGMYIFDQEGNTYQFSPAEAAALRARQALP